MLVPDIDYLHDGYFFIFFSSADVFSKSTFSKISFRDTIRASNTLNPNLGPISLQRLSANDTSTCKS